jgi:hypothetical protein
MFRSLLVIIFSQGIQLEAQAVVKNTGAGREREIAISRAGRLEMGD